MSGTPIEAPRASGVGFADTYRPPAKEGGRASGEQRTSGLWQRFDQAVAEVGRRCAADDHWAHADTQRTLAQLQVAVRRIAESGKARLRQVPSTVHAQRLLDSVRRAFLTMLEDTVPAPDSRQLVQVLSAMERLQVLLDSDETQRFTKQLSQRTAQQLLIEVAHDMRSPLGSILLLSDQLRMGFSGAMPPVQQRQASLIYSATLGLSSLVNDLLELAYGGERLLENEAVPFSIAEVLQFVRDIVQPLAEEKGLTLRFSLPESDSRVGHPAVLNRVLLNLTTNALKFTSAGSVTVACRQTSRTTFEFSVSDTGCGIPTKVMDALFDAFRPHSSDAGAPCTFSSAGLGLLISHRLVSAMDSQLRVESSEDAGTRFHFELELPLAGRT